MKTSYVKEYFQNQLPLAVVVTVSKWDETPRFRHQVTRQLLRFFNVLFIERPSLTDPINQVATLTKLGERLVICRLPNYEPISPRLYANYPPTRSRINKRQVEDIFRLLARYENKIILVTFEYSFWELCLVNQFDYKIYICNDEFPAMQRTRQKQNWLKGFYRAKLFGYYESKVAENVNYCLAAHQPLVDKLKKFNPNTELFLPGHEFNEGKDIVIRKRTLPIRVCFMGFLNYRLILEWLYELVKDTQIDLTMVGPVEKIKLDSLKKTENFSIIQSKTGDELQEFLQKMDVLIIPFDPSIPEIRALTVSNKFFQYISAGKPVVISDMPNYIHYPEGILYRSGHAKGFISKIKQAFYDDSQELVQKRKDISRANHWNVRGNRLYEIIRNNIN